MIQSLFLRSSKKIFQEKTGIKFIKLFILPFLFFFLMDGHSNTSKELRDGNTLHYMNLHENVDGAERTYSYLLLETKYKTITFPNKQYYKEFNAEEVFEWYNNIDSLEEMKALTNEIYFSRLKE